jgi:predicted O-methyltransferase YrrM
MKSIKKNINKIFVKIISEIIPLKMMKNKSNFHLWESKGYHVTPVQFYENIPDTRKFSSDIFERESKLSGIEMNEAEQLKLLNEFSNKYKNEYAKFAYEESKVKDFHFCNGMYETVDAEILYCMIRNNKPKRIIEIGSGSSTLIIAKAIRKNIEEDSNYKCKLTCIEPYPLEYLKNIPEVDNIIECFVETISLDLFKTLQENDILFIDSSHTINIYNDVCFEYLDILPNLNKNVIIHIHDILLPKLYCESWLDAKIFWNEQFLLQAFLAFNTSFKILWAGNFMHLKHSNEILKSIPSYSWFKNHKDVTKNTQGHKSFWIQKTMSLL